LLNSIILIALIILLIGAIPGAWPHSKNWSGRPVGILTFILVVVLIAMLLGGCSPGRPIN
jgi:ABC-type polysaccharide/polyol phosphate export permease